jgi:nitronate monooxygenase
MTTNKPSIVQALGIRQPIVQGPFGGGLSTVALTSTVSELGGLGSYGAHALSPSRIEEVARELRESTHAPFAINLWVSDHDEGGLSLTREAFEQTYTLFEPWYRELDVAKPDMPERYHPSYTEQIDALLSARPAAFSFVFGIPEPAILAECRRLGIVTIGAATSIAEAMALDAANVDFIVATGAEAGGHRPSFLRRAEDSLFGTFALVQLIADRVRAPVIAAGGIADARGVRAAIALGAQAAQIGTAFLACSESGTHDGHRRQLFGLQAHDTTLTRSFTGRLARGIRNRWTDDMGKDPASLPPFPVQGWFASQLRAPAIAANREEFISLWSGQIAPNLRHRNAADLMNALINE